MGIELQQGANALISENTITVGISWQQHQTHDLDVSAFLINMNGVVKSNQDFVFYNQPETPCGSVSLENKTEHHYRVFRVALQHIPNDVKKVLFSVTVQDDQVCCSMMMPIVICLLGENEELLRFAVPQVEQERALILAEMYRYQGGWKLRAVGQGYAGGLDALAASLGVTIQSPMKETMNNDDKSVYLSKRRTTKQIWEEKVVELQQALKQFIPQIKAASEQQVNESNTRMILDRMFTDLLGYAMTDIKTEQAIQGRRADYVLRVDDQDLLVCESKRAGLPLKDKHVFQATSYGAYSGIRWALLTNLVSWRVYHISTQDMVTANLVFAINLLPEMRLEDCERLLLISRYGMTRKGLLAKVWNEVSALTHENMIRAILTDDVINKIRLVIKRDTGCGFDNDTVRHVLEDMLIHN
ncbi:TerD family protein [Rhodoferax sp. 4810]|uniref:TerD family protein n=2 Tax=Thiospirillum jenense TaxID=1653858 RepID=A0A839HE12_9GAMM|nr:TerD family protein [Rhodoferax jenense]MBB1126871.1 TerD family protein [Thiospirillum jenense]